MMFLSIFPQIIFQLNAFAGSLDLDYAKLKSAKHVTFYLHVTNYFVPSPNMNETEFKRGSCIYQTEHPDQIDEVVEILANAELNTDSSLPPKKKGYRTDAEQVWSGWGIYFELPDGTEAKFLIGPVGYLIYPPIFNNYRFRYETEKFPKKLERWLYGLASPLVGDSSITSIQQCEDYRRTLILKGI